jgi:hypothetical protein
MGDFRKRLANGQRVDYTCSNSQFETDVKRGFPHGTHSPTRGSVLPGPISDDGVNTLWMEYIAGGDMWWMMWYDKNGRPNISGSAVFDKACVGELLKLLALKLIP